MHHTWRGASVIRRTLWGSPHSLLHTAWGATAKILHKDIKPNYTFLRIDLTCYVSYFLTFSTFTSAIRSTSKYNGLFPLVKFPCNSKSQENQKKREKECPDIPVLVVEVHPFPSGVPEEGVILGGLDLKSTFILLFKIVTMYSKLHFIEFIKHKCLHRILV